MNHYKDCNCEGPKCTDRTDIDASKHVTWILVKPCILHTNTRDLWKLTRGTIIDKKFGSSSNLDTLIKKIKKRKRAVELTHSHQYHHIHKGCTKHFYFKVFGWI